jgi:hypothetical protein
MGKGNIVAKADIPERPAYEYGGKYNCQAEQQAPFIGSRTHTSGFGFLPDRDIKSPGMAIYILTLFLHG